MGEALGHLAEQSPGGKLRPTDVSALKNYVYSEISKAVNNSDKALRDASRKLYGLISDGSTKAVSLVSPEIGEELATHNRQMSALLTARETLPKLKTAASGGLLNKIGTGAVAASTGNPLGAMVVNRIGGQVAEHAAQRSLGKAAKKSISKMDRLQVLVSGNKMGKWQQVLEASAQKGPRALAAQFYVLSSRDPELARKLQDKEKK